MRQSGFAFMMIVLGTIAVFYVWMRIDLLRLGLDIERMQAQKAELQRHQESLQFELSRLTDPQKIAKKASAELQLTTPKPGQIVMITPETTVASNTNDSREQIRLARRQRGEVQR